MSQTLLVAGGALAVVCGVASIRLAWRKKARSSSAAVAAGWIAIGSSAIPFSLAFGFELGPVYTVLLLGVVGLAAVALNLEVRPQRSRVLRKETDARPWTRQRVGRGVIRGLGATILAGVAAFGVGIRVAAWWPADSPQVVVFVGFAVWLAWAALAIWVLTTRRPERVCAGLAIAGLAAFLSQSIP